MEGVFSIMKNISRSAAAVLALSSMLTCAYSCSKSSGSDDSSTAPTTQVITTEPVNLGNPMEITWLADYDLNPQSPNEERPAALAAFEDNYGGKVKYIQTSSGEMLTKLSEMLNAGEEVDMFPYDTSAVPSGVMRNQFAPLDDVYDELGMNISGLWDDMKGTIESYSYNGKHYVIPYKLSSPFMITYSRKLMQEEELADPYELYQNDQWNWDIFMEMMEKFTSKVPPLSRYGITGDFGQALLQSTGKNVVLYDGKKFSSNLSDPSIEKAELLMQDIAAKSLYNPKWKSSFPSNGATLFFASKDWSLAESNANNPDMDLMVVPFPKATDADKYCITCDINAKMLVANSKKAEGVATYIMCERYAAKDQKYLDAAKQRALTAKNSILGTPEAFITEEQYDAIQSYLDTSKFTPANDFAYGMGEKMHSYGEYTYDTRGAMENLTTALLEPAEPVDTWEKLRDYVKSVIDKEIEAFNK